MSHAENNTSDITHRILVKNIEIGDIILDNYIFYKVLAFSRSCNSKYRLITCIMENNTCITGNNTCITGNTKHLLIFPYTYYLFKK